MSSAIEEATPEELLDALVEVSDSVSMDFKTFCLGYRAALMNHTEMEVEDNIDQLKDEAIQHYTSVLDARAETGELDELLDEGSDD